MATKQTFSRRRFLTTVTAAVAPMVLPTGVLAAPLLAVLAFAESSFFPMPPDVLDAMTSAITDSLAQGEKVTLVGFGTFLVQSRKARRGINPQTGDKIEIAAKDVPKFRPGRALREAVE